MWTSGVIFPRQLAPTVGPTHKGVEIKEGTQCNTEITADRTFQSRCNQLYTDIAAEGLRTDLVYKVLFASISVVGKSRHMSEESD